MLPPEQLPEPPPLEQNFFSWLIERFSEMRPVERVLWSLAGVLALVAFSILVLTLFSGGGASFGDTTVPTRFSRFGELRTTSPIAPIASASETPTLIPTLEPLAMPTPFGDQTVLTIRPNADHTGWLANKEIGAHWRDRNLHGGLFQDQSFVSVIQFDVSSLAPGSKIQFAALELTGRNARYLGTAGDWKIDLINGNVQWNWDDVTYDEVIKARALSPIDPHLKTNDVAAGLTNRFAFTNEQLKLIQDQLETGNLSFRISGSSSDGNDALFTWDAGPGVGEPTMYLLVSPTQFSVITHTPTPADVFAAATRSMQSTVLAQQHGTPTLLPRIFATPTGTPGQVVTNVPTASNPPAATFQAAFATAIAFTTGTYTPLPLNWVTATPRPLLIPLRELTPKPTATPTLEILNGFQLARKSLPSLLYNKIIFQAGSRSTPDIWVIDADGKNPALVTDRTIYDVALSRDMLSPNGFALAYTAPDIRGDEQLQIWLQDTNPSAPPNLPPKQMTFHKRGIAFAPAWSPDGQKIAYTSSESGRHEIMILDLDKRQTRQVTTAGDWYWNQYPSWSPDGKQMVYSSDRGHIGSFTELWIVNADGTGAYKLAELRPDAWGPVWIKWRQ